jgi:hypothetical protein
VGTPGLGAGGFASLLLHEGRSVAYVARQLGHGANLTMGTYGHVVEPERGLEPLAACLQGYSRCPRGSPRDHRTARKRWGFGQGVAAGDDRRVQPDVSARCVGARRAGA